MYALVAVAVAGWLAGCLAGWLVEKCTLFFFFFLLCAINRSIFMCSESLNSFYLLSLSVTLFQSRKIALHR